MSDSVVLCIRVQAGPGGSWLDYFAVQSMSVESVKVDTAGQCTNALISEQVDRATLDSIINRLNTLGLPLGSVECVSAPLENGSSVLDQT